MLGGIACFCGFPLSKTKIVENNRKNLNIFAAFGARDGFVEIDFSREQMKKILGDNKNLVMKEYKNYEHQVYVEELQDMKKFILNLIK